MKRLLMGAALVTLALAAAASGAPKQTAGTLQLHGVFGAAFEGVACPAGTPITTTCYGLKGPGVIPGLGTAKEDYTTFVEQADVSCPDWRITGVVSVAGKGEIDFAAASPGCVDAQNPNGRVNYTLTGGRGAYAGASGTGTIALLGR